MSSIATQINQSLFQISDPDKVYINSTFENNLQELLSNINEEKKFFLISGKKDSGKKTLIQKGIYELKDKALLVNIKKENTDYEMLIDKIGKSLENNFSLTVPLEEKLVRIKDLLDKKSKQHVFVVFDQSIKFKRTNIENGLLLANSSLSESCFFHLFITGLPGLSDQLKKSGFPATVLGDSCSFQIEPLAENDIRAYINFHIQHLDNQGKNIFSEDAIKQIIKYSKGLPGLINRLCSLGLLTANLEEKSSVSLEMINEVLENSLFLGNEFDYTPANQENSFSVGEMLDDSLTFNNTISPAPAPVPEVSKHTKSVDEDNKQPLIQNKLENQFQQKKPVKQSPDIIDATVLDLSHKEPPKTEELDLDKLIDSVRVEKQESQKTTIRPNPHKAEITEKHEPQRTTIRPKPQKKHHSPKKLARKKKKHASSKKAPIFSAFTMGVIFSTLICTGLYFFLFKNPETPMSQVAISESDSLPEKDNFPQQQLEARLNYLEQQLKKRQSEGSGRSKTEVSQQNTIDYVSSLPNTAAGTARSERDKKNAQNAKGSKKTEYFIIPEGTNTEEIKGLLLTAKQQLENKKLMTPANDNAWSTYKNILTLSPDNEKANSGIDKIKDTYIVWARHEIKKGNPKHATFLFKKALEISPDNPEILSAITTLEDKNPATTKKKGAFSKSNLFRLLDTPKGVEKLLAIAELQISRKNLTSPDRNSAYTIYKIILNRFPGHTAALKGLKKIKETYVIWAKLEIAQENYQLAESLYNKALKIAPNDPEIVSNIKKLRKTINKEN